MIDLAKECCIVFLEDPTFRNLEKVMFAMKSAMRHFNFKFDLAIKTKKFTINGAYTVKMPSDCIDVAKVGVVDTSGVYRILHTNEWIRRESSEDPCACNTGTTCTACAFHGVDAGDISYFPYWPGRYGSRQNTNSLGFYRYNEQTKTIEFGSGSEIYDGSEVLVEYQTTLNKETFSFIPEIYHNLIKYKTMHEYYMGKVEAEQFIREVRRESYVIKVNQMPTPAEILGALRGSRMSAPKS